MSDVWRLTMHESEEARYRDTSLEGYHVGFPVGETEQVLDAWEREVDALRVLVAEAARVFGAASMRDCGKCGRYYPEWSVVSVLLCPACRGAA